MFRESWVPRTKLGSLVKSDHYSALSEVLLNHKILEPQIIDHFDENWKTQVVSVDRVSHTLRSGKIYGFRVVALLGRKNFIGCGIGKSTVRAQAVKKAVLEAKKNMICLDKLLSDDTLCPKKTTSTKKGATTVTITPLYGSSVTASKLGRIYCQLCGVSGLRISTGNKKRERKGKVASKLNYFTALHESMRDQLVV